MPQGGATYIAQESSSTSAGGSDSAWYALYTRHQHEKTVAYILENKGHEVFLPLYSAVHRWQDRTKQLWLPLFPCYVFVRGGLDRRVQILSTSGVYTIVGCGGRPAAIPQAEIKAVRQLVESSLRVEPHPFLKCGDWVRIKMGPLRGVEGLLVRKKNVFRLVISVEMLGRSAAVEVDVSNVEQVNSSHAWATSSHSSSTVHAPARHDNSFAL
jgi:transcription antitermination factor NusG